MKDIDKMSSNELRAEVRVLRAVYEAAIKYGNARTSHGGVDAARLYVRLQEAIARVEAQDDGEMQVAALSEINR